MSEESGNKQGVKPVESLPAPDSGGKAIYHKRGFFILVGIGALVLVGVLVFYGPMSGSGGSGAVEGAKAPVEEAVVVVDEPVPLVRDVPDESIVPIDEVVFEEEESVDSRTLVEVAGYEAIPVIAEPGVRVEVADVDRSRGPGVVRGESGSLILRAVDNISDDGAREALSKERERRYEVAFDAFHSASGVSLEGYVPQPIVAVVRRVGVGMLSEGRRIPVLMTHSSSSDTPTPIVGVVSRDVVDDGGRVRIPRGTVLIGQPTGIQRDRFLGTWTKARLPGGREVAMNAMLTDREGRGGVKGKLYTGTFVQTLKSLASATVAAGVAIATEPSRIDYEVIETPTVERQVDAEGGEVDFGVLSVPQVVPVPRDAGQIAGEVYADHLSRLAAQQIARIGAGDLVRVETRLGARAAATLLEPMYID